VEYVKKIVDIQMLEDMKLMRQEGMANSEIAKRVGVSDLTVRKYLGNNPPGIHRPYKRKVDHVVKEPSVVVTESKEDNIPDHSKIPYSGLKRISVVEYYDGKFFKYEVDKIEHTVSVSGFADPISDRLNRLTSNDLERLIAELLDVMDTLK
jgi:predicted transcriptional regulator